MNMNMNKRWMLVILLILGAMIVSGCGLSREAKSAYDDAKDTLQKAINAGAKKCAPCQIATAEAALALAEHETHEMSSESHSTHFWMGVKIVKEKSLEAMKLTPCEKPAPPPPPPPPPAPPKPAPPAPPPPAPAPPPPPPPKPVAPPSFESVPFNENKSNISPEAAKVLDANGRALKENPNIRVEIGGHTDSTGTEKAGMAISQKRAESVKKYLMDKFNISGDRLVVKAYGKSKPIADNKTKEGRAKNRRVEIRIIQ